MTSTISSRASPGAGSENVKAADPRAGFGAGRASASAGAPASPTPAVGARRVAHSVAFTNSTLSAPPPSPQPSKMLVLPGFAEPSSMGELSPAKNTRPLPYRADAAMSPDALLCTRPSIHTSPRTVGLSAGNSVSVVPLWNASAVTAPSGPCVTLSEGAGFTLVEV